MKTLQQRLRQLRAWQGLTLAHCAKKSWQSLSVACEQQGIEQDEEAHRSLADTTMTWRLLQKLALQHEKEGEFNA